MIRVCFLRESPSHPSEASLASQKHPHASHLLLHLSRKTAAARGARNLVDERGRETGHRLENRLPELTTKQMRAGSRGGP